MAPSPCTLYPGSASSGRLRPVPCTLGSAVADRASWEWRPPAISAPSPPAPPAPPSCGLPSSAAGAPTAAVEGRVGDRRGYRVPGEVGELEGRGGGTGYRRAWLPEASLSLRDEASLTRLSSPACTLHPAPCDEASLLRLSSPACTLHPAPCDEASLSRLSSSWWSRSTTSCCAAEAIGTLVGTRGLQQQRRTTTYHHSRSKPSTCFPQRAVARRLLGLSSAPLPSLTYGICICICMCICICICICTCVCICMALGSLLSPLAVAHL